jgi:DivIVA domain-containing protein
MLQPKPARAVAIHPNTRGASVMPLLATDIDKVQFPTAEHGYSQAEVNEFLANVKISLATAEAALAQAREHAGAGAEGTPEATSNPVPIAARLLEFAQTAADEQLAAAHTEADRVMTEARAHSDRLLADAQEQAAATTATAEQTAARLVQTARDKEAEIAAHVGQLRETQKNSRTDLRQLAQHLTAIADTGEGDALPAARPENEQH